MNIKGFFFVVIKGKRTTVSKEFLTVFGLENGQKIPVSMSLVIVDAINKFNKGEPIELLEGIKAVIEMEKKMDDGEIPYEVVDGLRVPVSCLRIEDPPLRDSPHWGFPLTREDESL